MILTIEKPKKNQIYYSWVLKNYNMNIIEEEKFMNELFGVSGLSLFQVKYLKNEYQKSISNEEILEKHSIAPIMKVFMNENQYNTIINNIYRQSVQGAKSVQSLTTSLYRFKNNGIYKICPLCAQEDEKNYGFAYLHREHQLDGVRCCCKHEIDLVNIQDQRLLNNKLIEFDGIISNYLYERNTILFSNLITKINMIFSNLITKLLE